MNYNEPWSANVLGDVGGIYDCDERMVAQTQENSARLNFPGGRVAFRNELGRRIIAAVNACKDISTDRLEKMVPGTLANLLTLKGKK